MLQIQLRHIVNFLNLRFKATFKYISLMGSVRNSEFKRVFFTLTKESGAFIMLTLQKRKEKEKEKTFKSGIEKCLAPLI